MCCKLLLVSCSETPVFLSCFFFLTILLICNKSDFLYAFCGVQRKEMGSSSLVTLVCSEIWTFCSSERELLSAVSHLKTMEAKGGKAQSY